MIRIFWRGRTAAFRFALLSVGLTVFAGIAVADSYTITHYTGWTGGSGYQDGSLSAAALNQPAGIAFDAAGNLYFSDTYLHVVRKITTDGRVSTLAGMSGAFGFMDARGSAARFSQPVALAVDKSGNVYVADSGNGRIRKISPHGVVTTLADIGTTYGVAVDDLGNVYATLLFKQTVVKITPGGAVSVLAGKEGMPGSANGTGDAARFNGPRGIAISPAGDLYVAEDSNLVRKVTTSGVVTTVASVYGPHGVACDAQGNIYVSEYYGQKIDRITNGVVTTIAGDGMQGSDNGPGGSARFLYPRGLAFAPNGDLYVADSLNYSIRRITPQYVVSTYVGIPRGCSTVNGALASARFFYPVDAVVDSSGNLFIADARAIRKITPGGTVSTFAGALNGSDFGSTDASGTSARFLEISGMTIDGADNLYVTDREAHTIRKITPLGAVTTVAGLAGSYGAVNANGTNARFRYPAGLVAASDGTLYVADFANHAIRKITPSKDVTTLAGSLGTSGFADDTGTLAFFNNPAGVALDEGSGTLYVADYSNHSIRKITLSSAAVTTFAGQIPPTPMSGSTDGNGSTARFYAPNEVAFANGLVYVLDANTVLRTINSSRDVTTVAGAVREQGNVSTTGTLARFDAPVGLGTGANGVVYVVDNYACNVRLAMLPGIADTATATPLTPAVNTTVTLGAAPETATSWSWSVLRRPAGSVAELSATNVQSPTFTPDVADLFTLMLRAESSAGVRYTKVDIQPTDACAPLSSVVASITGATTVCAAGTGGTASAAVSGSGPVTYQWLWSTSPGGTQQEIAGANAASWIIDGAALGGTGTRYLSVRVSASCGYPMVSNPVAVTVQAAPDETVSAGSAVFANASGNFASVADQGEGTTYAWSITNGTIESGQGTRTIRYTAGAAGEVVLDATVTRNGCSAPPAGEVHIPIIPRVGAASMLYLVNPCRVIDTRGPVGPYGGPSAASGTEREIQITGVCGIPAGAKSIAANVTAVAPATAGYLALLPTGTTWPGTSTLNYRLGRTRANNAIISLSNDGRLTVKNEGTTIHYIIDVTGYFQ